MDHKCWADKKIHVVSQTESDFADFMCCQILTSGDKFTAHLNSNQVKANQLPFL